MSDAFQAAVLTSLQKLNTEVGELRGQCKIMIQQHERASDSRGVLHAKLDTLTIRVGGIDLRLTAMEPLVQQHEQDHQRDIGERRLVARLTSFVTKGRAVAAAGISTAAGAIAYLAGWLPFVTR